MQDQLINSGAQPQNVNYEVKMHFSEECEFGMTYTDDEKAATEIGVLVEIRDKETDNLLDGTDEEDFPNTEEGMKRAYEYAETLCQKYGLPQGAYEFY